MQFMMGPRPRCYIPSCGHPGHVTWTPYANFSSPIPWRLDMKFEFNRPSGSRGEDVWKCEHTTHRQTDNRSAIWYAHQWAFGSGELKSKRQVKGLSQSQTAVLPSIKRKRKPTNPNKHKSNKRTKSTKSNSPFPKRGNRNAKRTENTRTKWHEVRHKTNLLVE